MAADPPHRHDFDNRTYAPPRRAAAVHQRALRSSGTDGMMSLSP
jgi:hypothetical protein